MRKSILLLFLGIVTLLGSSCEDEVSVNRENLEGIWFHDTDSDSDNSVSRLEYHFSRDSTLEIFHREISEDAQEILGYYFQALGKYELDGDQLLIITSERYVSNDTEPPYYVEVRDLQPLPGQDTLTATISFEDKGRKLVVAYPPCGPLENCVASQIFQRR